MRVRHSPSLSIDSAYILLHPSSQIMGLMNFISKSCEIHFSECQYSLDINFTWLSYFLKSHNFHSSKAIKMLCANSLNKTNVRFI
jgi:hypothetical protein